MFNPFCCLRGSNWILVLTLVALISPLTIEANDMTNLLEESKIKLHYDEFMKKFHKLDARPSSELDLSERLTHFLGRTVQIFEHNMLFLKKQVSYHLERNQFADMKLEDLLRMSLKKDDFDEDEDAGIHKTVIEDGDEPKRTTILDFTKDPADDPTEKLVKFVELMGTKFGESVANEVVSLKEAFKEEFNVVDQNSKPLEPFNPMEALKSNLGKLRVPLESMLQSARGAFWDYLKDEGIVVDVERQLKERKAEVKRIRMRIDWRITGCISEPRQQSLCNSCYAISVVNLIEYFYCRVSSGKLQRFSPQYIVDCGQSQGMRGCQGGKLARVGQFVQRNGLQSEADFPYTGREGQCDARAIGRAQVWPHFKYWQYIHEDMDTNKWLKHLQKGPLLVGIGMPADFFAYGGGIHDGHNCNPDLVHAMLLVGYGLQDDKEFWLLQNSFSTDWGEGGYFRLAKDAPSECINAVIVARPAFDLSKNTTSII